MKDIKSFPLRQLEEELKPFCGEKYRVKQIFEWLHSKNVADFSEMTNIPAQLIEVMSSNFYINRIKIIKRLVSNKDDTVKYLYELLDGEYVETVFMKYHHGNSVCISTQVGCKMGCAFCASTKAGFVKNLTASEMLDQVYQTEKDLGRKISNIVLMGIGEPLDNFNNVMDFIELITSSEGHNTGMRHITISTCGIVPKIYELADKKLQLTLSVSLHATNDERRGKTMPVNNIYHIDELIKACDYYVKKTNRRITFEYALINGENDSEADALELAGKLKGLLCHVNLIPVNSIAENNYRASSRSIITRFIKILNRNGTNATLRRTLGQDIDAACGQLRRDNN